MLECTCQHSQVPLRLEPFLAFLHPAGVNYTRTACVIAVSKARDLFEPFLHQLGYRLAHVQRRMLPIAMHLLQVRPSEGWVGSNVRQRRALLCASSQRACDLSVPDCCAVVLHGRRPAEGWPVPERPRPVPQARGRRLPRLH